MKRATTYSRREEEQHLCNSNMTCLLKSCKTTRKKSMVNEILHNLFPGTGKSPWARFSKVPKRFAVLRMAFRARKVFRTFREKRDPAHKFCISMKANQRPLHSHVLSKAFSLTTAKKIDHIRICNFSPILRLGIQANWA